MANEKNQIKLMNDCIDWFNHRYPQLIGTLIAVPIGNFKISKSIWPYSKRFSIISEQIRLVFMYHQRVWIFEPFSAFDYQNNKKDDTILLDRMIVMHQMKHTVGINDIHDFAEKITRVLVEYQTDHP